MCSRFLTLVHVIHTSTVLPATPAADFENLKNEVVLVMRITTAESVLMT